MVSSDTEIANIALTHLGVDLITSLDDSVQGAILTKSNLPSVKDSVLRAYFWNCAKKTAALAPLSGAPDDTNWSYQFQLPPDCLRVRNIQKDEEYVLEGRKLLCKTNDILLQYTYRITDVAEYDALLAQAIAAYLAYIVAMPLTSSASLKGEVWEVYKLMIREARSIDAQEGSSGDVIESDAWNNSRR